MISLTIGYFRKKDSLEFNNLELLENEKSLVDISFEIKARIILTIDLNNTAKESTMTHTIK